MESDDERAIEILLKGAGFFEAYEKKTFVGYRNRKDGGVQKVTIDVLDAGPRDPRTRFRCEARSDDGKSCSGNSGPTLEHVLTVVHWYELDKLSLATPPRSRS